MKNIKSMEGQRDGEDEIGVEIPLFCSCADLAVGTWGGLVLACFISSLCDFAFLLDFYEMVYEMVSGLVVLPFRSKKIKLVTCVKKRKKRNLSKNA
jgi:hypothetical protein